MEQQTATMTEVDSVTELNVGDRVHVEGNGVDVTHEIEHAGEDAFGDEYASFNTEGFSYTIKERSPHPLSMNNKFLLAGHGTVDVKLVNNA